MLAPGTGDDDDDATATPDDDDDLGVDGSSSAAGISDENAGAVGLRCCFSAAATAKFHCFLFPCSSLAGCCCFLSPLPPLVSCFFSFFSFFPSSSSCSCLSFSFDAIVVPSFSLVAAAAAVKSLGGGAYQCVTGSPAFDVMESDVRFG